MEKRYIGKLLEFDRGELNEGGYTNGYLLGISDDWTFIQNVERDIYINGYVVILNDTIERWRRLDDKRKMVHRALRNLGQFPVTPPGIDLTDIGAVVKTAIRHFPLLQFRREWRWPDECHIGGLQAVTPKTVTITSISTGATYDGPYRMRIPDITRISFDSFYERALWAAAPARDKKRFLKHSEAAA